jgi:diguanylate cyclase (GGDEF)-like protein
MVKKELKAIKKGDFKFRINYNSFDEIDQIASLTNNILDEYEKLYNIEKKNAILDPLTKCYNRRALDLEYEALKEKIKREKKNLSFLIFDIDDFKKVNDTYGHPIGDCVLVELSKTMKGLIRKYDNIYRIGGEEFLVIFYNLKKKEVPNILNRILKKIPYNIKKNCPELHKSVTISGGFINLNYKEIDNTSLNEIIEKADKLLYEAKKNGKNQIKSEN